MLKPVYTAQFAKDIKRGRKTWKSSR